MYRGYKDFRSFLNRQLHALSHVISGSDEVIDAELAKRGISSVKDLSLQDAKQLYKQLLEVAKKTAPKHDQLKQTIGLGKISWPQRNQITAITRYKFKWSDEAIFSYIAGAFPDYRKRLTHWEIENSKLNKLYNLLTQKDADKIIKRLMALEKKNKAKAEANLPAEALAKAGDGIV